MFADYKLLVFRKYEKKMADKALSPRFIQPSPAQIRDECIAVCGDRYDRKDEQILRIFFGHFTDKATCLQAIKRCEVAKLKPFGTFLRKPSTKTEPKNVELLAWLIDFEPRPYELGRRYDITSLEVPKILNEEMEKVGGDKEGEKPPDSANNIRKEDTQKSNSRNQSARSKVWMAIIAVLVLMPIGILGYWFWNNNAGVGEAGCMYWAGDHYQQIPCSPKPDDTLVIALDPKKINSFKRITELRSINKRSIGKVWYVRVNDTMEFYTSDGFHPTELQLRLKPITKYIIDKYIP